MNNFTNNFDIKKFFNFDIFISINIIKILYILSVASITLSCIFMPFSFGFSRNAWTGSSNFSPPAFLGGIVLAIITFSVWQLCTRVFYELIIVILKINENLQTLVNGGEYSSREIYGIAPSHGHVSRMPPPQKRQNYGTSPQVQSAFQQGRPSYPSEPKKSETSICSKCLSELKPGATFCEDCGQKV
ncbi:MAG: DUF4282 domain-containing protein [Candidatus Eremiobacterota bacterium]